MDEFDPRVTFMPVFRGTFFAVLSSVLKLELLGQPLDSGDKNVFPACRGPSKATTFASRNASSICARYHSRSISWSNIMKYRWSMQEFNFSHSSSVFQLFPDTREFLLRYAASGWTTKVIQLRGRMTLVVRFGAAVRTGFSARLSRGPRGRRRSEGKPTDHDPDDPTVFQTFGMGWESRHSPDGLCGYRMLPVTVS